MIMEGGVQIISREIVKPSSQTHHHHPKKLKLSYLDKILSQYYIPLIFFYNGDESTTFSTSNHFQLTQRLKHSLSQILPSFYPLSGRLKNNVSVDCNDAGVEFVVARVSARFTDVPCLDSSQLKEYLPASNHTKPRPLLQVQINFFDRGGVVISALISHAVADLASAMAFLKSWDAACRGEAAEISSPLLRFGTTAFFPSFSFIPLEMFQRRVGSNENFKTGRFVFDKAKLDMLRTESTSESESAIKNPSRVELVSAFIWKHFMEIESRNGKRKKIYAALHAVNLRQRVKLFENVFGNCVLTAFARVSPSVSDEGLRLQALIARLRRSIRKFREGYIMRPMRKESYMKDFLKIGALVMMGKLEVCFFTSWRGFPTYELDYGWGKPDWFTTTSFPAKNMVVLISSKSGDDVEAIVTMLPHQLQMLDAQIKLISTSSFKD